MSAAQDRASASHAEKSSWHVPVLAAEIIESFSATGCAWFFDATLGDGGHTEALLTAFPESHVIACDVDHDAMRRAKSRLAQFGERVHMCHINYAQIERVMRDAHVAAFDGILADVGVSSLQVDDATRGLSFRKIGPLDMRMDRRLKISAEDVVNNASETELAKIFWEFGEERKSRAIAKMIVTARSQQMITTTTALADLVARAVHAPRGARIHPATRVFQALRIAVNHELDNVQSFVRCAPRALAVNGQLAIISYHSLEDRIVKQGFRACALTKEFALLTKKPREASACEIEKNPRARSAKLRILQRVSVSDAERGSHG